MSKTKKLINILGLTGLIALLSYTAAVVFSPLAFPGYNALAQAVPPEYFGVVERLSVFAAVGFNAVLGIYLFTGFGKTINKEVLK